MYVCLDLLIVEFRSGCYGSMSHVLLCCLEADVRLRVFEGFGFCFEVLELLGEIGVWFLYL